MIRRALQRLVFALCYGAPRPCGDPECVAASPEQHGLEHS